MKNRTSIAIEKNKLSRINNQKDLEENFIRPGLFAFIDVKGRLHELKNSTYESPKWVAITIKQGCLYGRRKPAKGEEPMPKKIDLSGVILSSVSSSIKSPHLTCVISAISPP